MKILFLCRLYWPHKGGVEKHVEKLSQQLIKHGHQITIITEQFSPEIPDYEIKNGVTIWRIPYFALNSKLSLFGWMEQHIKLFDEADIVHIHDVFWWYLPIWSLRILKPVYITFHGYEGNNPPTKKAIMWRKIAEFACRGSICIGDFMKKWYKTSPTLVSYGAANMKPLPQINSNNAVFMGRYSYDTGVDIYLEAVIKMKKLSIINFYGEGELNDWLLKRGKTSKRIRFHDWTRLISTQFRTHRYSLVSRYLSILESMQSKRLVVAVYNNQIKKDYLECHPMRDNMVIVGSSSELVGKLELIMDNPKEEELMIERAFNWAKKQTWKKMMGEYLNLWGK